MSYVIDIVETERELNISHLAVKWQRFSDKINGTYFFICFSPTILTAICIPLLGYQGFTYNKFVLSIIISLVYITSISLIAIKPLLQTSKVLMTIIIQETSIIDK